MANIRRATPTDSLPIAAVKRACWPDDSTAPDQIAVTMTEPDHAMFVSLQAGVVAGFVDGFLTLAADGTRRWEVDLLAVHPSQQRRGLGHELTATCTAAGREFGATVARAFIHVDNKASQHTFERCGYRPDPQERTLLISTASTPTAVEPLPAAAHLVPVVTLNYSGLWIEGQLSAAALTTAQTVCARHGWDVAGAMIPAAQAATIPTALDLGFQRIGAYRQWICPL